jgi:putative membrane protein
MVTSAIVAYLHYISFMVSFGALAIEGLTLKPDLSLKDGWRIVIADAFYGVAATTVLVTGVLRVLYFGKGTDYYVNNPIFWVKVGLFLLVGTVSLYPTISFIRWVNSLRQQLPPKVPTEVVMGLRRVIQVELLGFLAIPLFAALMARGIGLG